uniref:hypothetical protein n=1 Tax=Microbulbifer agarilyticus TaxID=260552 RepID=UPI000255B7D4|nr:hypothetical protein [Microbulbifer agarilyticus]
MESPDHLKIKNIEGSWANLSRWLISGGAATDSRWFYRDVTAKIWQTAIKERLPFVEAATDHFNHEVTRGTSESSIYTYVNDMNNFMKWIDENKVQISLDDNTLEKIFLAYDEFCYLRAWGNKKIKPITAYKAVFNVAQSLSKILERPAHAELKYLSRTIKAYSAPRKTSVSPAAEKQHLSSSQLLGYYCVDISDSISIESIYGQLPLAVNTINLDGAPHEIKMPLGLINMLNYKGKRKSESARTLCKPTEKIDKFRGSLIRIRILAELVIFVYQTGMSVSQILQIERKRFSYKLQGNNDWLVTCYKGRKQGPIKFTIYKDYKKRLKNLIKFVDHFFPDKLELFPVSYKSSKGRGSVAYKTLTSQLRRDGIPWVPPRITRNTRANFLNRMTGDSDLSAEMNQHTREVFRRDYNRPSQHRAMAALTKFWPEQPVSLINSGCGAQPESCADKPLEVIAPNCVNESGCLWCTSHRDIESEDYVWSLATFRHLKLIEAAQPVKREIPADLVVARLSEKIEAFKELNHASKKWVSEALMRIEEGCYHSTWKNVINFWES